MSTEEHRRGTSSYIDCAGYIWAFVPLPVAFNKKNSGELHGLNIAKKKKKRKAASEPPI